MSKTPYLEHHAGKQKKLILYPVPDLDQSQNVFDWPLAEDISFHKIWSKSVNSL